MSSEATGFEAPAIQLWCRYWCFGWLFLDADRGSRLEREAALRHNRHRARWLPTYLRRWSALGVVLYLLGVLLELAGLDAVASIAFVPACVTVPVLAVATAAWLMLRGRSGRYIDATGRR